jgi:hypothetical protein
MVLITSMNKPSFRFEMDLNSRKHKSRCELGMDGTALETFEMVTRVEY